MIKVKDKIIGWWVCLIGKFLKKRAEVQLVIYGAVFVLPVCLTYLLEYNLNIYLFVYYLFAYFFFQIGLSMVKK